MSFDGYCFIGGSTTQELGGFANRAIQAFQQEKLLPQSLSEFRACLFFEGRRWHHLNRSPGGYGDDNQVRTKMTIFTLYLRQSRERFVIKKEDELFFQENEFMDLLFEQ